LVEAKTVDEMPLPDRPVAGLFHEDVVRISEVLATARWPLQKWQLLAHAVQDPARCASADPRTIQRCGPYQLGSTQVWDRSWPARHGPPVGTPTMPVHSLTRGGCTSPTARADVPARAG
jgi:hypothetical protein